jgi:hypothetical protein
LSNSIKVGLGVGVGVGSAAGDAFCPITTVGTRTQTKKHRKPRNRATTGTLSLKLRHGLIPKPSRVSLTETGILKCVAFLETLRE